MLAISLVLLLLGVVREQPWKGYRPDRVVEIDAEPIRVASNVLRDRRFADPFPNLSTGPTAHVAPCLPFLQTLAMKCFGFGAAGWLALRTLPAWALSLEFALLPWLSTMLRYRSSTGVLAALFGILIKPELEERWEAHLAGLMALLLTAAACRWLNSGRKPSAAVTAGGAAGVAMLSQPVLGAVWFCWIAAVTRMSGLLRRSVLPLWLVPLLIAMPWTLRNAVALKGLVPIRDDLGLELYVSFNDCAPWGFRENMASGCIARFHPTSSFEELNAVRDLGEYRYNQDRLAKALRWISANPLRAAALTAARFWFFWFPSDDGIRGYARQRPTSYAAHILTILSFVGLYAAWKRRPVSASLLLCWVVVFPLVYYAVQFDPRYRYPILWTTWLLAADGLVFLWSLTPHRS